MTARFECSKCQKTYPNPRSLKAHQRRHEVTPRACPVCGKEVVYLLPHVRRHPDALERLLERALDLDDRLAQAGL